MFDIVKAYSEINKQLFDSKITPSQEDGHTILFAAFNRHGWKDFRWMAYALATAYHETAKTMQPIDEKGSQRYFLNRYDRNGNNPKIAAALGNTEPGDGVLYHGRGHCMITGRRNYALFAKRLQIELVKHPDLAKIPNVSADILCEGMEKGLFTGVGLAKYFDHDTTNWVNARRIINGNDKDVEIAEIAKKYYDILSKAANTHA